MEEPSEVLLEDTRNRESKHSAKHAWWGEAGVRVVRSKLAWGDYCLPPVVSVDTKQDIYELAQNIDQGHARFRAECTGARDAGCQLVVLVENDDGVESLSQLSSWSEDAKHFEMRVRRSGNRNARRISGERLAKACLTMQRKYGVRFEFCRKEDAAKRVVEILTEQGRR